MFVSGYLQSRRVENACTTISKYKMPVRKRQAVICHKIAIIYYTEALMSLTSCDLIHRASLRMDKAT
jgi:hypothetical protein